MSSDSDDLSSDSNSSSISSNSIEYHEWESRVVQYNQRTDRILEDVIINYPNLFIQDQTSRARRAYRDREREQGEALLKWHNMIVEDERETYRNYDPLNNKLCIGQGMFGEITGTGDVAVDGDGHGDYKKRLFFISYMK
ncbi:hypothetical protein Tco_1300827 [Tanacetum coccineum]